MIGSAVDSVSRPSVAGPSSTWGSPARIAIGVNLVALCLSAWLMRKCESMAPALVPDAVS